MGKHGMGKGTKRHQKKRTGRKNDPTTNFARRIHYPLLPKQFHAKLAYSQRTTTASAKGTIGLISFLNSTPLYMDALYQMYTYSKILAVDVHIEAINLDTTPYDFVLAICPQTEISTLTVDQAKQSQGAVLKTIGTSAGMNRIIIRKHYDVEKVIGYHLADRDTRMTFSDANNSSQSDTSLPALVFFPSLITGASTLGVSISVVVHFHCAFFDLYVPSTSAMNRKEYVEDFEEISEKSSPENCELKREELFSGGSRKLDNQPSKAGQTEQDESSSNYAFDQKIKVRNNLTTISKPFVKK
jgi:hypothetical protein